MRPDDKKDEEQARLEEEKQRKTLTIRSAARAGTALDDFGVVVKQVTAKLMIAQGEGLDATTVSTIIRSLPRLMQQPGGIGSLNLSPGSMRGDYLVRTDEYQQRAADQKRFAEEEKARKVKVIRDREEMARLEREQQDQHEEVLRGEQEEWDELVLEQCRLAEAKECRLWMEQEEEEVVVVEEEEEQEEEEEEDDDDETNSEWEAKESARLEELWKAMDGAEALGRLKAKRREQKSQRTHAQGYRPQPNPPRENPAVRSRSVGMSVDALMEQEELMEDGTQMDDDHGSDAGDSDILSDGPDRASKSAKKQTGTMNKKRSRHEAGRGMMQSYSSESASQVKRRKLRQ